MKIVEILFEHREIPDHVSRMESDRPDIVALEGSAPVVTYMPSVFYFRKALRDAVTKDRAITIGLVVCAEHERLRAWVREQGMFPPKWVVDPQEAADKGLPIKDQNA